MTGSGGGGGGAVRGGVGRTTLATGGGSAEPSSDATRTPVVVVVFGVERIAKRQVETSLNRGQGDAFAVRRRHEQGDDRGLNRLTGLLALLIEHGSRGQHLDVADDDAGHGVVLSRYRRHDIHVIARRDESCDAHDFVDLYRDCAHACRNGRRQSGSGVGRGELGVDDRFVGDHVGDEAAVDQFVR